MAENNQNPPPRNNHNGPPHPPPQYPLLQIQDIDDWLRFNGLRAAGDDDVHAPEYNSFMSHLNQSEVQAKQIAHDQYQQQIHASIFQDDLQEEEQQQVARQRMLELWADEEMDIVTSQQTFCVSLRQLAAECDTIFTLASSRRYMHNLTTNKPNTKPTREDSKEEETIMKQQQPHVMSKVTLSLEEYPTSAVHEFLTLALSQKTLPEINDQHVVDCCQIGHYLQCARILEGTSQILLRHVDSDNCLSLCQMADQLGLPDLFERALFHMLKSLDNLEAQEAYEDFSVELKDRIADIRTVFTRHQFMGDSDGDLIMDGHTDKPRQEEHGNSAKTAAAAAQKMNRLKKKRPLYFTSLDEYIAIFAETVQYHRERLQEAKEQNTRQQYSSYAQSKIEKQELRVLTLEAMLQEQKRLFGGRQKKGNHQYYDTRAK